MTRPRVQTGEERMVLWRGRNWMLDKNEWSDRYDGWWIFGYWAWTPKLKYLPIAIWHRLTTGESNYFYTRWEVKYD